MAQIIRVGFVLMAGVEPATFRLSVRDHATRPPSPYILYLYSSVFLEQNDRLCKYSG